MAYYLIPKTTSLVQRQTECSFCETPPTTKISNSLSNYLYNIKEKLYKREKEWDIYKKYTNPYEYIHTVVPYRKKSVSKYKPLSRSYFKMIELINIFSIEYSEEPIRCFHLAEGPGGFIEAICNLRKNPKDIYIGMTLLDTKNDTNIPAWKKSNDFLKKNPNVSVEPGIDNTGNILSLPNFRHCVTKYSSSFDFITADGGFDFSVDFNKQEITISRLLFAQVAYAVSTQKYQGTFILKLFDCFMEHTVDILCLLSSFYDKVYITKPQTSRYANSEKYIVCKGFLFHSNESFFPFIYTTFEKMVADEDLYIHRFLNIPISYYFLSKIEEINAIFGQQQIENIHYTISLIENRHKQDKLDNLLKLNIQKCVQWCIKYNIEYNVLVNNQYSYSTHYVSSGHDHVDNPDMISESIIGGDIDEDCTIITELVPPPPGFEGVLPIH